MINWIEAHLTENPSLLELSRQIGYSPYYCSSRFHEITGMTFKSYVAGRQLTLAALEIRDSQARILDIALKYGYSTGSPDEGFYEYVRMYTGRLPEKSCPHPSL